MIWQKQIEVATPARGLIAIDAPVDRALEGHMPETGLLNLYCRHTSASLLIQENADPTAGEDLEAFFDRLAPDGQDWHRHTAEGVDDSSAHMKCAVLPTELTVPITGGRIALGQWQGLFLFEHRRRAHTRTVLLTVYS